MMLEDLNEYDIVQNLALASTILLSFSLKYYKATNEARGIDLSTLMLVLPLVFNESVVEKIYKKNYKRGLYNAINETPTIFIGLQERMQDMSKLTMNSINVCLSSNFLIYDKDYLNFIPTRDKIYNFSHIKNIKKMITAADRLGFWFAAFEFDELCKILKVRF